MCNKDNLPNRVEKARAAVHFAKITQYDRDGRVKVVIVPGSQSKQYQVILRRDGKLTSEVNLLVGNQIIAPEWKALHISYHAMAAVEIAASEGGYRVTWFANEDGARRYARFGGQVCKIHNFNNPNVSEWFVINK